MKNLTLIFFAIMCCCSYSCKKKVDPVLAKQDTSKPIDTVVKFDSNYLYAGVYNMYVHYHSYHDGGPGRVDYDTMYWCKMNIEYKPSDSIVSAVSISYTGTVYYYYYKHPLLILTNLDNGIVYRKLGLDTMGRVRNGKSVENYTVGGFVNRDSINCYLFTRGNHEGENDTLIGHKIP